LGAPAIVPAFIRPGITPSAASTLSCAASAQVAEVVTAAGRADLIEFSVSRNVGSCKGRAAPPEGNGTRATPARSSHDFDCGGTAVRCCWRTRWITLGPAGCVDAAVDRRPLPAHAYFGHAGVLAASRQSGHAVGVDLVAASRAER
jgi:hypothetical protein